MFASGGGRGRLFVRQRQGQSILDMTPLVDVVFQLLIFFMVSSTFVNSSMPLELPKAGGGGQVQSETLVISLGENGELMINSDKVTQDNLVEVLRGHLEERDKKTVNFRGHDTIEYARFVEILSLARKAGVEQFNIEYQQESAQ